MALYPRKQKWLELSIESPPEFVEPLSHIFLKYGHGGVAIEQKTDYNPDEGETPPIPESVTLKTYLPLDPTATQRRNQIDLGVRLVSHMANLSPLQAREVDEEEWQNSWKEHFDVLRVGRRIVIKPTWHEHQSTGEDVVVTLDPGMAFGTGHHPTTRMCLEILEEHVSPGMEVFDLGCGSGILSIAAARLGAARVVGLEIDPVAVDAARQNLHDNSVGGSVRVIEGTLPNPTVAPASFDLAVANISAKVVSELAGDLVKAVRPGGTLIASGILLERKQSVAKALGSAGAVVRHTEVDGDWIALVATAP